MVNGELWHARDHSRVSTIMANHRGAEDAELTQRGLGASTRNMVAPEEPNVYNTSVSPTLALQRSAMFLGVEYARSATFCSSGARKSFWGFCSINIRSLRDQGVPRKSLSDKQEADGLLQRKLNPG